MSNKVKDEVIWVRIYDTEPTTTPSVADIVGSSGIEISKAGLGLQDFNLPKEAPTRENTGRDGWMRSETQGTVDYEVDFQVDWDDDTDDLLDSETKYLAFVRREKGTAAGRTQQLGGGPIMNATLVDRDGGWAFDMAFDGDIPLVRSAQ